MSPTSGTVALGRNRIVLGDHVLQNTSATSYQAELSLRAHPSLGALRDTNFVAMHMISSQHASAAPA